MRINLFLAATALTLWSLGAPTLAAVALCASALWLFVTAVLLDFTLRHSREPSWQLFTSALLVCLIASAPERHGILIWVWAALFMLPQGRAIMFFNVAGAMLSWLLVAISTPYAQALILLLALAVLTLLACAQGRWMINVEGDIRQRLRLIPGLNLWAGEQLLRDLTREQIRAQRENIYAEVLIVHVKRHQLWACGQRLCELTHDFENVYRLSPHSLAVVLLCCNEQAGATRRHGLFEALSGGTVYRYVPLGELDLSAMTLESLNQRPGAERYST